MAINWIVIYIILQQLAHLQIQHAPLCMLTIDMSVATWHMDRSGGSFKCIIWYRWRCGSFNVEGSHGLAVEERTTSNGSHGCWKDNLACQFGILCKCFLTNRDEARWHIDSGHVDALIERILTNLSHRIWQDDDLDITTHIIPRYIGISSVIVHIACTSDGQHTIRIFPIEVITAHLNNWTTFFFKTTHLTCPIGRLVGSECSTRDIA